MLSVIGGLFAHFGISVMGLETEGGLCWTGLSGIVLLAGVIILLKVFKQMLIDKATVRNGSKIPNCRIINYEYDLSFCIQGAPLLRIVCEDEINQKIYILDTGTTLERRYPIGALLDLYELNGYYTFDKKSVRK